MNSSILFVVKVKRIARASIFPARMTHSELLGKPRRKIWTPMTTTLSSSSQEVTRGIVRSNVMIEIKISNDLAEIQDTPTGYVKKTESGIISNETDRIDHNGILSSFES